ncbi:MAG: class I SAM-dependent methyltransferase, partial [Planctomycetota bacterium]|nr:class I SAM-dependent methyltransferase [Planctomycetota bacterium]
MRILLLGLAATAAGLQSPPDPANQDPEANPAGRESYLGREVARTMHWRGAPWLLRATREDEENGERLRTWLDVRTGESVCDLGCGNGYHTLPLAAAVGPEGRVFAVDLQPEMLDLLAERADGLGLSNLVPVEATVDDPRLPEASVDTVLMVDVYHELSHPVRVLGHVRRALKRGGRVVLVEFRSEDRGVPIKLRHKMSKAQVIREMAANGFRLADETDALPWQHAMAFEAAPEDPRLEARELARGFARAASGSDARVLLPYLAPLV